MRPTLLHHIVARRSINFSLFGVVLAAAVGSFVSRAFGDDATVDQLVQRVASEDRGERLEAIREIARRGPAAKEAVPQLVSALKSDDLSTQYESANALAAVGPQGEAAEDALEALLDSDLEVLQYAAANALRQVSDGGNNRLTRRLRQVLSEDSALGVRVAAARALVTLAAQSNQQDLGDNEITVLLDGLASDEDYIASDAMHGLAAVGEPAAGKVAALLNASSATTRSNAAHALAILGLAGRSAGPRLIELVASAGPVDKRGLLRALSAVSDDPDAAISAILRVLENEKNRETRLTALEALGAFGVQARPAVPAIVELLQNDDLRTRLEALETIREIGPGAADAVPQLVQALHENDGLITIEAAQALAQVGQAAVPSLTKLLDNKDYQLLAATILADIGPEAAPAVPRLLKLLDHPDEEMRRAALLAIAGIGPAAGDVAPRLLEVLHDPESSVRPGAAYALARIGAQQAVPALKDVALSTDDDRLQLAAAWALVILQPEAEGVEQAVPALVRGLSDPWELVRRECVVALGTLGPKAQPATGELMPLLGDPDPHVRAETLVALQRIGADTERLVPQLIEGLDDETPQTRYASIYVLGQLGEGAAAAVPRLREILNQRSEFDRILAAWALVKINPTPANKSAAVPLMLSALENPSAAVRQEAAAVLGESGDRGANVLDALRQVAAEDSSPEVQQAARQALESLGGA